VADWKGDGAGFRLGGDGVSAAHVVTQSAAWDNATDGFTGVDNKGGLVFANDTAYRNGGYGFRVSAAPTKVVAAANGGGPVLGTAAFASTDPRTAQGPRPPDGRLPATRFLVGTAGADMREQ
jgi:hypothetical protein